MQIGTVLLDRYELVGRIGEGATSAVWEAEDRLRGERVAVKAISLDEAGWRAEVRDRFQQEARLLALGRHEHLVGVRDVGETDDGYLFIVLDKLTGETLAARIARPAPMPWREAARIALQIARGLGALHAQGIVHRDIKPANVILHEEAGKDPVAKIIDLGVSKVRAAAADPVLYATLTATGQVIGTPEYMSYEQALGERDIDVRSDVWAVGVVLYEMLAGMRPFAASNVNAVLAAIRKGAPPSLAEIAPRTPAPLIAVVERCLDPSREARYADGAALAQAIESAVAEAALAPGAPSRPDVPAPRNRLATVGIAVVLAVAAAIGLYLLLPAGPAASKGASPPTLPLVATPPASADPSGVATIGSVGAKPLPGPGPAGPPRGRDAGRPGSSRPVTRINDAGF